MYERRTLQNVITLLSNQGREGGISSWKRFVAEGSGRSRVVQFSKCRQFKSLNFLNRFFYTIPEL